MRAAVEFLRQREDIQRTSVGLIGHSEGGVVAPLVAEQTEIDFTVLLAYPAETGLVSEFGKSETTTAPQALEKIADWITSYSSK